MYPLSLLWTTVTQLIPSFNEKLDEHFSAHQVVYSLAAFYTLRSVYHFYQQQDCTSKQAIRKNLINKSYEITRRLPIVGKTVENIVAHEWKPDLLKLRDKFYKDIIESGPFHSVFPGLDEQEESKEEKTEVILGAFSKIKTREKTDRLSGELYAVHDKKLEHLIGEVYKITALTNPMHDTHPEIKKMSAEIISWFHHLLNGRSAISKEGLPLKPKGIITEGGTYSIHEAVSAYVLHAKKIGITQPEIIAPNSVHVSVQQAAKRFGARLILVPVNKTTGTADVNAMKKAITSRTCLLIGSAPSFAWGVMDPIEELAKLVNQCNKRKFRIGLHVDACLGGGLLVFMDRKKIPRFDFSVKGVTSISLDPHKFCQTPKGFSLLLLDPQSPISTVYGCLDSMMGAYVTPGMKGSRQGHAIAVAWAIFKYIGYQGYVDFTYRILDTTQRLYHRIHDIPGIKVIYQPHLSVIGITTDAGINSHLVACKMEKSRKDSSGNEIEGWKVNTLIPTGFHFCVTAAHTIHAEKFVTGFAKQLEYAVHYAKHHPHEKPSGMVKAYGMFATGLPKAVEQDIADCYEGIFSSLPEKEIYKKATF